MLKLPVIKTPDYLSPTGFLEWERCPMKFYLKRLSGLPWPEVTQGRPAAVGSSFDAHVCNKIAIDLGLGDSEEYQLGNLLKSSISVNDQEAIDLGAKLFYLYVNIGCYDRLMKEGISDVHPKAKKILSIKDQEILWYCKPDVSKHNGTVCEFKVNGAFSTSGQSPKPGYERCYFDNGEVKFAHSRSMDPLEEIDKDWATQLTVYNWMNVGILPFRPLEAMIEQVSLRPGRIAFASFRLSISAKFQQDLWNRAYGAWKRMHSGDIPDAIPEPSRCNAYNQICEVADRCTAFQKKNEILKGLI